MNPPPDVKPSALATLAHWPVPTVAAAVVGPSGVVAQYGDVARAFPLASVTKPLVARAALVAVEEGVVELDTPAGPPGSTVRHLLAHASGLAMRSARIQAPPATRRIYSNAGFGVLAALLEDESGMPFADYLGGAVFEPLAMTSSVLSGGAEAAGFGVRSSVSDLAAFAVDLLRPRLVSAQMHAECTTVQFPGWRACSRDSAQRPNDWGLGVELRDGKSPHWTGGLNSGSTFGHFGQSGTFLWVDPVADLALVVLTDRDFGDWVHPLWPALSDEVLREFFVH